MVDHQGLQKLVMSHCPPQSVLVAPPGARVVTAVSCDIIHDISDNVCVFTSAAYSINAATFPEASLISHAAFCSVL